MNDPLIVRFADACGASAPLNLRVDLAGGGLLAEGSVAQPFTLVGRDDSCDVTLSDPDINPRHAWLQTLGGRVYAVDLGSRTGVVWAGGLRGSGWLDAGAGAKLGPFMLRLNAPVTDRPGTFPPDYNPLAADTGARPRPPVALEFRNGKRAKDRWLVNRLITLIGRAPECKIHLTADDISHYHCGLVSTPSGLWVVDLSGRGVVVNGERMRVAPLAQGAELWVGRFLIGCHYPPAPRNAPGGPSSNGRVAGTNGSAKTPPVPVPRFLEDEVELGAIPDPNTDLPSSHILADAFRATLASGPASNPILVSGSGPSPGAALGTSDGPLAGLLGALGIAPTPDDGALAPILQQMAELHARMTGEFAQWLALMTRLFGQVRREHLPVVQHELNRIEDLTAEIAVVQAEVSRQAIELAAADRAKQPAGERTKRPEPWVPPGSRTPIPDTPLPARASDPTAPRALDRLNALQQERAARWEAVLSLFTGG